MYQDFETELTPTTHKKRYAKVTLYLEVPSYEGDSVFDEYDIADIISKRVTDKKDIFETGPAEAILSPVGSDDPSKFKAPVGFIAPDGKFYLLESTENGLAHLTLANLVYSIYKDSINHKIMMNRSSYSLDYRLEYAGFIKVHAYDIRYYAHLDINFDPTGKNCLYTPDITDAQKEALITYIKKFNLDKYSFVNDTQYTTKDLIKLLKEGDIFVIRKIFEI